MKKLILSTLLSITLFSCKKEVSSSEEITQTNDTIDLVKNDQIAPLHPLNEKLIDELSKDLQRKNDTLYITNFFATWCGPCVKEIPHFKNKIEELKGQPVKITFVSVDNKDVWATDVEQFVDQHGIRKHTVLLDGDTMTPEFFASNFKEWRGDAIPFTMMRKGNKTEEILGMINPQDFDAKIESFK